MLAVVTGKQYAESELKKYEDSEDSSDRHEGWRYFIEKTNLQAGTDPVEATQRRQAELEGRESKALQETKAPNLLLHILRDEIAEAGVPLLASRRLQRDWHRRDLSHLGAPPEYGFFC